MNSIRLLLYLALAAAVPAACTAQGTDTSSGEEMRMTDVASPLFDLSLDDYWDNPWKNLEDFAWDRVSNRETGIEVSVPPIGPLDRRKTVPLLVFESGTNLELSERPFEQIAVVALMNPDESHVAAAQAILREGPPPERTGPPTTSFTAHEYLIELTEILGMPMRPSRYVATVILRDRTTRRVAFELRHSEHSFHDPEVERFIEKRRRQLPPRPVSPPASGPQARYIDIEDPLPIPGETGMNLRADRVVVNAAGESGRLQVAFRMPVVPTDVYAEPVPLFLAHYDASVPSEDRAEPEEPRPMVLAVARITLLLVGSQTTVPRLVTVTAPTFEPLEGTPEAPVATGRFELDLLQLDEVALSPETNFIYGFCGEYMTAEPTVMAVVDREMVPGYNGDEDQE